MLDYRFLLPNFNINFRIRMFEGHFYINYVIYIHNSQIFNNTLKILEGIIRY